MAADNIIIKFEVDKTELEQGIDGMVLLGKVDKQVADSFKASNAEYAKRSQALNEMDSETKQSTKSLDDLNKNIKLAADESKKANDVIKNNNKTFDEQAAAAKRSSSGIGALRQEIKSYISEAIKAGETTPIGKEFLRKAGEAKDRMDDLKQSVKGFASDTRGFDLAVEGAKGVAAGFAIAQGAAALFGKEDKELQKTLVKVQGSLAVLTGLQEVQNILTTKDGIATKIATASKAAYATVVAVITGETSLAVVATNALNASLAVLSGGATLVIAAIVASVGALATYVKVGNAAADAQQRIREEQEAQLRIDKIFTDQIDKKTAGIRANLEFEVKAAEAAGKSQDEILRKKKALNDFDIIIQKQIEKNAKTSDTAFESLDKQSELRKGFALEQIKADKDTADKKKEADKKAAEDAFKNAIESEKKKTLALKQSLIDQLTGNQLTKQQFDDKIKQLEITGLEKTKDVQKRFGKDTVDIEGQIQSAKLGVLTAALAAEQKAKEDAKKRDEENRKQDLQETVNTIDSVVELQKSQVDLEILNTADATSKKLAIERQGLELKKEQLAAYGEDQNAINLEIEKKDIEIKKDAEQRKRELIQQTQDFAQSLSETFFNVQKELTSREQNEKLDAVEQGKQNQLASLDDQLKRQVITQEQYEKRKKQIEDRARTEAAAIKRDAFQKQKQADIIQGIINTALAITRALPNPFLAIAAGIAGAAQVALIATQPIPKFAKGTKYVTDSNSPDGIDTVHSLLTKGERVITKSRNREYTPILDSIHDGLIPAGALNAIALGQAKIVPNNERGFDEYAMARAMNGNGVNVQNASEIGKAVANNLNDMNYFYERASI